MNYKVVLTRHNWKENENFNMVRKNGCANYLLLHFKSPVIFTLFEKERKVLNGECIILSPNTPHAFRPDNCKLFHDWMHFVPENEEEFLKTGIKLNTFFAPQDPSFITASTKRCEYEMIAKDEFFEEMISAETEKMLIKIKRSQSDEATKSNSDFKALRLDVYTNPQKYKDSTAMAEAVSLSRTRFSVVYKNIFGTSPKKDLIDAKISKAEYLLSAGSETVSEVAGKCGYTNVYHFIKQFKKETGKTPGEYKKRMI